MKEFDLSDKELKELLQMEGLEEPSMGFNHALLEKVTQYEKTKIRPVYIPKWLKVTYFSVIIVAIGFLLLSKKNIDLEGLGLSKIMELFTFNIDLSLLLLGLLSVIVVWMAVLLNRYFKHQELERAVKKG
ncbi:hypothetical protein [Roseivirga echinicomitans]|uniref:Uncharacterized protein n=1 Tax=Roseivirga echinicomitans TaxID=296218 RepID=A0A150XYT8_9BACT|nr:hypothetical protein [Roseivirga echinicomitans]KYG83824.1 hypothetical protein AWN68_03195 [Roseivirga echinicomitans]